jgi:hypothetical protein
MDANVKREAFARNANFEFKKNENILKNFDKILATSLKGSYAGNWIVIVGLPTYSSYIEAENMKTIVV